MKVTADQVFNELRNQCRQANSQVPIIGSYFSNNSYGVTTRSGDISADDLADLINYFLEKTFVQQKHVGEVVVTTDEDGNCLAVTRQDDEGRVLKVIWMKKK